MLRYKNIKYLLTSNFHRLKVNRGLPTAQETTDSNILIQDTIPQFGWSQTIQSDNDPAFTSLITQQVSLNLNISWHLHIPYHPQSLRKVEKANRLLKGHLMKLILKLHLSWPQLLSLDLTPLRASQAPSFLSPFQLTYGKSFTPQLGLPNKIFHL